MTGGRQARFSGSQGSIVNEVTGAKSLQVQSGRTGYPPAAGPGPGTPEKTSLLTTVK